MQEGSRAALRLVGLSLSTCWLVVVAASCGGGDKVTGTGGGTTPTSLAFFAQPSAVVAADVMTPAVTVAILDRNGSTVTSATTSITIAITPGSGTAGAVLGGTTTVAAINGVARFSQLTVDRAGTGYTLSASASSLTGATSSAFTANPWRIVFVNTSFTPMSMTGCALVIPANAQCTFSYSTGRPASVHYHATTSGTTSGGVQVGLLLTWDATWPPSADAADTINLIVPATYFYLFVQNHSIYTMQPLYVNYGLVDQTLDNIVLVPGASTTYGTGYYKAYTNTVVRAYRQGSSTAYWNWSLSQLPMTVNQSWTVIGN